MEQYCASLYHHLQNDIAACKNKKLHCMQKVETCFGFAFRGWMELSKKLRHHRFDSEESEIRFFKTLKPKITAEIEYYSLVYHALLFQPDEQIAMIRFWRREYERLERFKTANQDFIECYNNNQDEKRSYFFLRQNYDLGNATNARIYDADMSTSTNGDWSVATMLALAKYSEYVKKKLKGL